jgi:hypothetical protein
MDDLLLVVDLKDHLEHGGLRIDAEEPLVACSPGRNAETVDFMHQSPTSGQDHAKPFDRVFFLQYRSEKPVES